MQRWRLALVVAVLGGCLDSQVQVCGNGLICPEGTTCDEPKARCIDPIQRTACAGVLDGGPCAFHGLPGACDEGLCVPTFCGDSIKNPGEECDGPDLGGQSCTGLHYYGETSPLACNADCTFDRSGCVGVCGDGIKNGPELCDGGDLGVATCVTLGYYNEPGLACSPLCTFDATGCTGTCGDGIKNGPELCDGTDLGTPAADCTVEGFYDAPGLACSSLCGYDTDACTGYCGDGVPNGAELCDTIAPTETCVDAGFDVGRLDCSTACGFAFGGCGRIGWRLLTNTVATGNEYRLHASSRTNVWGVSNAGKTIHFDGLHWTTITIPIGATDLESVWTASSTNAWATDATGMIWHWDGTAWANDPGTARPAGARAVWGTSATDVWVVTSSAVHRWNGTTWAPVGSVGETGLDVIHGSSSSDVWVSNGANVRHWNGTSWSASMQVGAAGANPDVAALYVISPTDAWAVGTANGTAMRSHWDGSTWTMTTVYSSSSYRSITGSASNDVWASGLTGSAATVEHWDGHTWLRVEPLPVTPGSAVHLYELDAGAIYGATSSRISIVPGLVYSSNDASSGSIFAMASIFSTQDDYIFLGGGASGGSIALFDQVNWGTASLDGAGLGAAWGLTGTDSWIVTGFGNPYHYNNNSFTPGTFSPPDNNPPIPTSNMWGSASNDIWYAGRTQSGNLPVVRHYNGSNWTPRDITISLGAGVSITRISGSGPNDVWALTSSKRLFHWDGAWTEVAGTTESMEDMVVAGPGYVIVTGARTAHHRSGTQWVEDTLPNLTETPVHLVALAPDWVFGATTKDIVHYDGVRWSQITPATTTDNGTIIGLGITPNRLDIAYDPASANTTWVRGLVVTQPWRCVTTESGHCGDGMDNDCDGRIDVRDSDCP